MFDDKITEIYVAVDDFYKEFSQQIQYFRLQDGKKCTRNRKSRLSDSEMMTILICFHHTLISSHFIMKWLDDIGCTCFLILFPMNGSTKHSKK